MKGSLFDLLGNVCYMRAVLSFVHLNIVKRKQDTPVWYVLFPFYAQCMPQAQRLGAAALFTSTDGEQSGFVSGYIWGFCSVWALRPDSGCTRRPAVSRSRSAPYRSLTRLSLDVNRGALPPVAEMPIGAGTVSRWVRAAATYPPCFDPTELGSLRGITFPSITARPARNFLSLPPSDL